MKREAVIHSVQFGENELGIDYLHVPDDVRAEGSFFATHRIAMRTDHPRYEEYRQEIEEIAAGRRNSSQ